MQKMAALVAGLRDITEKCNQVTPLAWIKYYFDFLNYINDF